MKKKIFTNELISTDDLKKSFGTKPDSSETKEDYPDDIQGLFNRLGI